MTSNRRDCCKCGKSFSSLYVGTCSVSWRDKCRKRPGRRVESLWFCPDCANALLIPILEKCVIR